MKKFLYAACMSLGLVACGGGADVEADAKAVCDCYSKANGMASDDPKRAEEQNNCMKMQGEKWMNYKDSPEDGKKFNDIIGECSREMMENSLNGTVN